MTFRLDGRMELIFRIESVPGEEGESCILNVKYRSSVPSVIVAYRNGDYRSLVYVSTVAFNDAVDAETMYVVSKAFDRFQSWNEKSVKVYVFPRYYMHPWKNVLVCVDESAEKYVHLLELIC